MLHFSKIAKLEVKFDALKSHVTCEISISANNLDSLLLVLHETLNNLGQNDVKNNKLLLENFEFYRKEILSKNEFIKDLMETQTTVLDVESGKGKRQMFLNKNNSNNKIYKDHIYSNMFYVNTTFVKINNYLKLKFFNQMSDQKTGKNVATNKYTF